MTQIIYSCDLGHTSKSPIKNPARGGAGDRVGNRCSVVCANPKLRMNNAFDVAPTKDVLKGFPDETISASAAIRTHLDATNNCRQLIKSEFGVGHGFE